jgi:hypothetical protein
MGVLQQVYLKVRGAQKFLSVHFDFTYCCHRNRLHRYLQEFFLLTKGPESELGTAEIQNILDLLDGRRRLFPFLPAPASLSAPGPWNMRVKLLDFIVEQRHQRRAAIWGKKFSHPVLREIEVKNG